VKFR